MQGLYTKPQLLSRKPSPVCGCQSWIQVALFPIQQVLCAVKGDTADLYFAWTQLLEGDSLQHCRSRAVTPVSTGRNELFLFFGFCYSKWAEGCLMLPWRMAGINLIFQQFPVKWGMSTQELPKHPVWLISTQCEMQRTGLGNESGHSAQGSNLYFPWWGFPTNLIIPQISMVGCRGEKSISQIQELNHAQIHVCIGWNLMRLSTAFCPAWLFLQTGRKTLLYLSYAPTPLNLVFQTNKKCENVLHGDLRLRKLPAKAYKTPSHVKTNFWVQCHRKTNKILFIMSFCVQAHCFGYNLMEIIES